MKADYTQQLFKLSCQFRDGLFCFRLACMSLWEFVMKGCGLSDLLYLAVWSCSCCLPLGLWPPAIMIAWRGSAKVFPQLYMDGYVSLPPKGASATERKVPLSYVAVLDIWHAYLLCAITLQYGIIKNTLSLKNDLHELKSKMHLLFSVFIEHRQSSLLAFTEREVSYLISTNNS